MEVDIHKVNKEEKGPEVDIHKVNQLEQYENDEDKKEKGAEIVTEKINVDSWHTLERQ
jgi:hypothetical protein